MAPHALHRASLSRYAIPHGRVPGIIVQHYECYPMLPVTGGLSMRHIFSEPKRRPQAWALVVGGMLIITIGIIDFFFRGYEYGAGISRAMLLMFGSSYCFWGLSEFLPRWQSRAMRILAILCIVGNLVILTLLWLGFVI